MWVARRKGTLKKVAASNSRLKAANVVRAKTEGVEGGAVRRQKVKITTSLLRSAPSTAKIVTSAAKLCRLQG